MKDSKCFIVKGFEIEENKTDLKNLPEINHQINIKCQSGLVYANKNETVAIRSSSIGPNGYLASHKASGTVYVIIVSGSGKIGITDQKNDVKCEISVEAGDEIIFEDPMELHYYTAGDEGMSYRVINF